MSRLADIARHGVTARATAMLGAVTALLLGAGACDYEDPVATGGCDNLTERFEAELWEPLLGQRCVLCHRDGGLAGHTAFVLSRDDGPEGLAHNLSVVAAIADERIDGESVLLLRPTGRHPEGHGGGALVDVGDPEYEALSRFVRDARVCDVPRPSTSPGEVDCDVLSGPRLLRRLARDEWAASVEALLGIPASPDALAPDDVRHGFDNQAAALGVSDLLADQLAGESEHLARAAIETRGVQAFIDCDLAVDTCAARFVRDVGVRAFRRPLTDAEVARYLILFEDVAAEDGAAEGAVWVLTAMLQSPHFLYRSELGTKRDDGAFGLTGWEKATALAFLAWGAPPDEALLRRAANGDLDDDAVALEELARLTEDPRALDNLDRFGQRWLGTDRLPIVTRDASTYPELTPEVRADMAGEAARLLRRVAEQGGTVADLLEAREGFMTDRLADYYGVARGTGPADAQGFRRVDLSGTKYGGLLRLGAVLTTHALPQSSSPIHRGKMVRERLLCEDLPPPPSNLDTSPPPMDPTKSTRERYAAHAANEACAVCHEKMDPIGWGFERYDGIGRWRERDGVHAIDDSGHVSDLDGEDVPFAGPEALATVLADSRVVDRCYLAQRLRFGFGYDPPGCLVEDVAERQGAAGGALTATPAALVASPAFTTRHGGAAEGDTLAVGAFDFDAPNTDPPGPIVDPGDPTPTGDVAYVLTESSRWETGYCSQVDVTNPGGAAVEWRIELGVEGVINNLWNATSEMAGARLRFKGVDWNRTLAPGATTNFGFCAQL